jgi:hypothetical protein
MGKRFPSKRYWLACFWVAPNAGMPKPNRERPKTPKLDAVTGSHGIDNPFKNNVHDLLDVALGYVRIFSSDALDELGFDHRSSNHLWELSIDYRSGEIMCGAG